MDARRWLTGLLLCASPLLHAQMPAAAPEGQAMPTAADEAGYAAHRAYLARIVPALVDDGGARELAYAALLREVALQPAAEAGEPAARPQDGEARAWRETAAARAGSDVVALALLVAGGDTASATRAQVLARWRQVEPGNLAPWLFDGEATARQIVAAAGDASRADAHTYAQLRWMLDAHHARPPLAAEAAQLFDGADGAAGTLDGYVAGHGMGLLVATAVPRAQALMEFCGETAAAAPASLQGAGCRKAAGLLMAGDTNLMRMLGFALAEDMVRDDDAYRALDAARRRFDWQMLQWGRLSGSARGGIDDFVRLLRDPAIGDEPALVERLLREAGIPLDPPAGWRPPPRD